MTVHRAKSTQLEEMFQKIIEYADRFSIENNLKIIFPVHPRTKKLMNSQFNQYDENFIFTEPLSYFETQYCLSKADYVLRDSGGLQKEAYFHRVPSITLRTETEWVETIENGWNRLWTDEAYQPRKYISDYGNGGCAERIIQMTKSSF